jgi:hypothetical protein
MKRLTFPIIAGLGLMAALAFGPAVPAHAQGLIFTKGDSDEPELINEIDQKAVVFFSRGQEDLIVSPSYQGNPRKFCWIMAVPARPTVTVLRGSVFHELAAAWHNPDPENAEGRRGVVGAYDVAVVDATTAQGLRQWLKSNGYSLPRSAMDDAQAYLDKGWTFVAAKINNPADAKQGLKSGMLAPLRLTFKTNKPVLPVKLASHTKTSFKMLTYFIIPENEVGAGIEEISLSAGPDTFGPSMPIRATVNPNDSRYPTIAKLTSRKVKVFGSLLDSVDPKDLGTDVIFDIRAAR